MHDGDPESVAKPRLLKVVAALVVAAAVVSYLAAYALADALVNAEVLPRWPPGHDPRPMRMSAIFAGLLLFSVFAATLARRNARRHIRRIDEMGDGAVPDAADELQ